MYVLLLDRLGTQVRAAAALSAAGVERDQIPEAVQWQNEIDEWLDAPDEDVDPERAELLSALGVRGG